MRRESPSPARLVNVESESAKAAIDEPGTGTNAVVMETSKLTIRVGKGSKTMETIDNLFDDDAQTGEMAIEGNVVGAMLLFTRTHSSRSGSERRSHAGFGFLSSDSSFYIYPLSFIPHTFYYHVAAL